MKIEELDNKIDQVLSGWETPSIKSKQTIWRGIVKIEKTKTPVYAINKWRWVAAASIITLAALIGVYSLSEVEVISNGKIAAFELPDGSSVKLNGYSTASFNSSTWFVNRSVTLSGEGFFNVKKGSQFTVTTQHGTVKVLGTSFNVLAKTNNFIVQCFTGKVSIDNGKYEAVIEKGEKIRQSTTLSLVKESPNQVTLQPAWLNVDYSYANEKIELVLSDISNHFGVNISTSNKINKLSFTGAWNKTMTLDEVLKIVCLPFDLEALNKGDKEFEIEFIEK